MIVRGTNWAGNYSRFAFSEIKRYFAMLKEQGKPVTDDEFNILQDMQMTAWARAVKELNGDGSPNLGLKIVGTGAVNNFTISGGTLYVGGLPLLLPADITYTTQEIAGPALTTPGGARTDKVYVDTWLDEIGPATDPDINDPTLAIETSRRLKLKYRVLVAEGSAPPADYTDANGIPHRILLLATLSRTATNQINIGMVADERANNSILGLVAAHNANLAAHQAASTTVAGFVELLTDAEAKAGADAARAATAANLKAIDAIYAAPVSAVQSFARQTAPTGWLRANGATIGSAASGATARANADTEALFIALWTDWDNTQLIIQDSTGANTTRGAGAAADFAANKRLPLPDLRGRAILAYGQGAGLTDRTFGLVLGAETHVLGATEIPLLHTALDIGHDGTTEADSTVTTQVSAAHPNMQPSMALLVCIKY